MSNKLVGTINLIIAIFYSLIFLLIFFVVQPKLESLYIDFGKNISSAIFPKITSLFSIGINFLFAYLNLKIPNPKSIQLGLIASIISILFFGYFISYAVTSIILPIYQLTNQF